MGGEGFGFLLLGWILSSVHERGRAHLVRDTSGSYLRLISGRLYAVVLAVAVLSFTSVNHNSMGVFLCLCRFVDNDFLVAVSQDLSTHTELCLSVPSALDSMDRRFRFYRFGLHSLRDLFQPMLLLDCSIYEGPPLLQLQYTLVQVSLVEVGSCDRAHILLLLTFFIVAATENMMEVLRVYAERHLVKGLLLLLVLISLGPGAIQTLHPMNTNEVGHPSIHLLSIEQLESQVVIGVCRRARRLLLKVLKVNLAVTYV